MSATVSDEDREKAFKLATYMMDADPRLRADTFGADFKFCDWHYQHQPPKKECRKWFKTTVRIGPRKKRGWGTFS